MGSSPNTVVLILAEEHLEGKRVGFQSALHSEWGIDYNILFLVIGGSHTKFSEHAHYVAETLLLRAVTLFWALVGDLLIAYC